MTPRLWVRVVAALLNTLSGPAGAAGDAIVHPVQFLVRQSASDL
jgi:hypothetical protein